MDQEFAKRIAELKEAILVGDETAAADTTRLAIEQLGDHEAIDLISDAVRPALDLAGEKFQAGEMYLPELMLAGYAAQVAIELILPLLPSPESALKGTVVIGSPTGDLHDIGKNIVSALLTAHGFKVVDLGVDVPPSGFIKSAQKEGTDIIAVSTLLSTCLPYQREIVNLLSDMGCRDQFYVICGGGPVTPEWVQEIRADGYGREAADAVALCDSLLSHRLPPPLPQPRILGALRRKT